MRLIKLAVVPAVVVVGMLSASNAGASTYVVQRGDTLWGISRSHHLTLRELEAANRMPNYDYIRPGQKVTTPDPPSPPPAATAPAAGPTPAVDRRPPSGTPERALLVAAARHHGVNPNLVLALSWWESGWNQGALSSAGAVGMMQVLPSTADWAGPRFLGRKVDVHRATDNVEVGTALLRHYLDIFDDPKLALAAYYQGETATHKYGVLPGSRRYVDGIWSLRNRFQAGAYP